MGLIIAKLMSFFGNQGELQLLFTMKRANLVGIEGRLHSVALSLTTFKPRCSDVNSISRNVLVIKTRLDGQRETQWNIFCMCRMHQTRKVPEYCIFACKLCRPERGLK